MDAETLERLLMDRALGGLTADVEDLLAACLERDAEAAARAREFEAAAVAARQVLRSRAPAALPPFPAARIHKLEQARRRLAWVRSVAGVAASLIIGVGLGSWLFTSPAAVPSDGTTPVLVRHGVGAKAPDAQPKSEGFWSVSRLVEQARRAERADSTRLIWDSPVSRPRLGGEL